MKLRQQMMRSNRVNGEAIELLQQHYSKMLAGCRARLDARQKEAEARGWRPIIIFPDRRLAQATPELSIQAIFALRERSWSPLSDILDSMALVLETVHGSGLAAPQLGWAKRCSVLKVADAEGKHQLLYLLNPQLLESSGEQQSTESCLSLPGLRETVKRPAMVRIGAFGYNGERLEVSGDGILACRLMHELDHLDGKLLTDSMSPLRRSLLREKFRKAKREGLRYFYPDDYEKGTP